MANKTLSVSGMTCGHCEQTVKQAVSEIIGVREVGVNLERKEVTVGFDETKVTVENILAIIEATGFEVGYM